MNLNQITLPVHDITKACAFYKLLGMTQIVDSPHYARFICPDGDTSFSLMHTKSSTNNNAVIYFEHKQLHELCASLKRKGLVFEQDPSPQTYLWEEAILKDPSGNLIKLYWAGENRLNPPWRINTAS